MSELICIAFKDSGTADRVLDELRAMETNYVLDLEDAVIVVRDMSGKVHLKQCVDVFGGATVHGVSLGVLWGGLMGLLFINPLAGLIGSLAGGAGAGAITTAASEYGLLSDYGIPDNFIKALGSTITRGTSAIFLLIHSAHQDKLLAGFSRYEGTILNTSLSGEQEEKLRAALTKQRDRATAKN
ncbi:MAG: DUF1269 domain-containing protein [Nitrospira sp.]|nr:DUF1269 domain-containing protein [Nitrospira sp.]